MTSAQVDYLKHLETKRHNERLEGIEQQNADTKSRELLLKGANVALGAVVPASKAASAAGSKLAKLSPVAIAKAAGIPSATAAVLATALRSQQIVDTLKGEGHTLQDFLNLDKDAWKDLASFAASSRSPAATVQSIIKWLNKNGSKVFGGTVNRVLGSSIQNASTN